MRPRAQLAHSPCRRLLRGASRLAVATEPGSGGNSSRCRDSPGTRRHSLVVAPSEPQGPSGEDEGEGKDGRAGRHRVTYSGMGGVAAGGAGSGGHALPHRTAGALRTSASGLALPPAVSSPLPNEPGGGSGGGSTGLMRQHLAAPLRGGPSPGPSPLGGGGGPGRGASPSWSGREGPTGPMPWSHGSSAHVRAGGRAAGLCGAGEEGRLEVCCCDGEGASALHWGRLPRRR
jgi:hypothetical protein